MHSLNICHMDIKPENVAWSEFFGKFVFLDFGFTSVLSEPAGNKSKTGFKGTYNYCSPEMKKLYYLKKQEYVDLYYNDLHCLELTWKQMDILRMKAGEN